MTSPDMQAADTDVQGDMQLLEGIQPAKLAWLPL